MNVLLRQRAFHTPQSDLEGGDAEEEEEEAEAGHAGGCRSKNKNPTQFCGEKHLTSRTLLEVEMLKKCAML